MTEWQFDKGMIEILKDMNAKTFLSYERDTSVEGEAYGALRINLDDCSIMLKNEGEEIALFENDIIPHEEASKFSCSTCDLYEPFTPGLVGVRVKKHDVNEKVVSVEIVTDTIQCPQGGIEIAIDMALIIKTEKHVYLFSKSHVWFDEVIYINIDKNFDKICPLHSDLGLWNNDGEWDVSIERTIRKL